MKRIKRMSKWLLAIGIIVIVACQPKVEEALYPTDLEGQRKLLAEKKMALKEIEGKSKRSPPWLLRNEISKDLSKSREV
jgi:hypothetical protein